MGNEGMKWKYEVREKGDSGYCRMRYKFMRGPLSTKGSYVAGSRFLLHKPNVITREVILFWGKVLKL